MYNLLRYEEGLAFNISFDKHDTRIEKNNRMVTLPLILFIVMTELSIGAFTVLFVLDWRNTVKRNFLVTYGIIYFFLAGLTYLFQQNFATADLLNTYTVLDKAWTGYLSLPLLLFLLLLIPYNLFLWFDKLAGVDEKGQKKRTSGSLVRSLRLVSGGLTVLAGLFTLFVMGMIFRPLASTNLAEVFTVASFFAAAFAVGGVLTAMWLGHWYLVTPALSEKPYLFATTIVLLAILAQVIIAFIAIPGTTHANTSSASKPAITATATTTTGVSAATPTPDSAVKPSGAPVATPLSAGAIGWLRILVGFVIPLVFGGFAWKLIRDRSFQSATGMLYLVVVCTLAGEAMARGLFLMGLQ
jgi:DMSO reductase anchor subunit